MPYVYCLNVTKAILCCDFEGANTTSPEVLKVEFRYNTLSCSMTDFKYGVTFNTYGNTNRSVNSSHSTQCKMLTSRPTEMLAMMLHF